MKYSYKHQYQKMWAYVWTIALINLTLNFVYADPTLIQAAVALTVLPFIVWIGTFAGVITDWRPDPAKTFHWFYVVLSFSATGFLMYTTYTVSPFVLGFVILVTIVLWNIAAYGLAKLYDTVTSYFEKTWGEPIT